MKLCGILEIEDIRSKKRYNLVSSGIILLCRLLIVYFVA
jgi:hypothetical protein